MRIEMDRGGDDVGGGERRRWMKGGRYGDGSRGGRNEGER